MRAMRPFKALPSCTVIDVLIDRSQPSFSSFYPAYITEYLVWLSATIHVQETDLARTLLSSQDAAVVE
jgi:hypothetical protein